VPAHGSRRGVSAGPIEVLAFDEHDARTAGEIRAALEAAGTPIGAYDLLIAGQALRRGYTLVTAIVPAFARVPSLSWEDWATPPSDTAPPGGSPAE
jgi:tRNA(fMet)-specific endonuclease VapC